MWGVIATAVIAILGFFGYWIKVNKKINQATQVAEKAAEFFLAVKQAKEDGIITDEEIGQIVSTAKDFVDALKLLFSKTKDRKHR